MVTGDCRKLIFCQSIKVLRKYKEVFVLEIGTDDLAAAWERSKSRCECKNEICVHIGNCRRLLIWNFRGLGLKFSWEAFIIEPKELPVKDNILILCRLCYDRAMAFRRTMS
jgi:hypothetical protein